MTSQLAETFLEMIRRASTDLPADVDAALRRARRTEQRASASSGALEILLDNIAMARDTSRPMCQDTGTNTWWITRPAQVTEREVVAAVHRATRKATKLGYLRPNSVDSLTGRNSGDNIGLAHPVIHVHEHRGKTLTADLLLKGGGCENVSGQLALPDVSMGAGRDLDGVRKAVLKLVQTAQGKGCAPGVLGVCIGGDRVTGFDVAKRQLLRALGDHSPEPALAKLERRIFREANRLGIGPMGFGGKTTVLGVNVACAHRLPASFFVTVAYSCWALRKAHGRIARGKASFAETSFAIQGA